MRILFVFLIISSVAFRLPNVTAMLGVTPYVAKKVVDAMFAGASAATIYGLIASGFGILAIGLGLFKQIVKAVGRGVTIGW